MSGSKIRLYGSTSGYVELEAPAVAPDGVLTLPATTGAFGGLVAVNSVLKTDTFTASVAAGGSIDVTDLSITHEVADASNRLIISAFFGAAASNVTGGLCGLAIYDGSSFIANGDTAGSRTTLTAGGRASDGGDVSAVAMPAVTFVHTPGTGSKTYTVRAVNIDTSTRTLYINRSENDADSANRPRAVSALVIQEVSV